ncbi:tigger transposable element-derived protein 6 [Rhipicephalus sanguineus]|uniref:tigger transposable element-derived protein 6 n=1 Tax=Rhipicephalus sanguineus TaxID=34632 RepID=UPI0018951519|nr:tigger transposable element-derived protein 6 [Rhipicephalus sanguineus]
MTGTEKLPLLIIGKALKPRCFKNIRTLPAEYTANSKAWMTREIFKQWLIKLDRRFELANRRVLLIVDNCSAHAVDVELKAIKLAFLPPNTTAALQPMDQGVINNLKCFYRRHMLERLVLCASMKDYNVTLLTAMHMLVRAWDLVTATTVANCFRHSGFCAPDESPGTECEAEVIPAGLRDALDNVSFDDYVDVDNSAVVCGTITDDDIIAQVTGGEEPVVEADKSDEQEEVPTRPSASQLLEAIGVARLFFSFEEGEEDAF